MIPPQYAIVVEGMGKRYHIGRQRHRYRTLRDTIANAAKAATHRVGTLSHRPWRHDDTIWALSDVSFTVERGTVFGIVGGNGSGKTTILKVLGRITEPTRGRAEICGRVGCVLEVGTGFHPELTGRENVFLSGIILGMKRREIVRKLDEIVAFSGLEQFMDTPVKHYSSGMAVRLGFAVAAHLEPDVLLIDEVLAVGDAQFQRRCVAKMNEAAASGRTILFVSHDLERIRALCQRALWLDGGRIEAVGDVEEVLRAYDPSTHPE
jgi:lipopolysaccharide transport system ATP-binding protein